MQLLYMKDRALAYQCQQDRMIFSPWKKAKSVLSTKTLKLIMYMNPLIQTKNWW